MKFAGLAAAAVLAAVTVTAFADPPPVEDWAPNESVVVTAQSEGPAFWHIKKGESEIYIFGTVAPMPNKLAWNSAHLNEIIKGSRVVLTAPSASAGFFETSWFLLTHRGLLSMPDGKTLEETLSPDLKTRFVAVRRSLDVADDEYADDPPVVAAMKLQGAFNKKHGFGGDEPLETVKRLARENHVPVRPIGEYGALGLVKEGLRLPPEAQRVCLADSVAFAEIRTVHNTALAEAWATGNVKAIKAHFVPDVFERCIRQVSGFGKLKERAVADYLKAIHEALAQPGKVVMLADIGSLLRATGVAEQLHNEGVIIEGPAE